MYSKQESGACVVSVPCVCSLGFAPEQFLVSCRLITGDLSWKAIQQVSRSISGKPHV
ncbi:UNVERIFIED_CONTAM: hypothetical protein FKN15_055240 [Acipenser sinensis]